MFLLQFNSTNDSSILVGKRLPKTKGFPKFHNSKVTTEEQNSVTSTLNFAYPTLRNFLKLCSNSKLRQIPFAHSTASAHAANSATQLLEYEIQFLIQPRNNLDLRFSVHHRQKSTKECLLFLKKMQLGEGGWNIALKYLAWMKMCIEFSSY